MYSNEIMITGGEVEIATDLDFLKVFLGLAGQWYVYHGDIAILWEG
jgi:hypothetical protein